MPGIHDTNYTVRSSQSAPVAQPTERTALGSLGSGAAESITNKESNVTGSAPQRTLTGLASRLQSGMENLSVRIVQSAFIKNFQEALHSLLNIGFERKEQPQVHTPQQAAMDGAVKHLEARGWAVEGSKNDPGKLIARLQEAIKQESKEVDFELNKGNAFNANLHKAKINEYEKAISGLGNFKANGEGTKVESKTIEQLSKENALATLAPLKENLKQLEEGDKKLVLKDGELATRERAHSLVGDVGTSEKSKAAMGHVLSELKGHLKSEDPAIRQEAQSLLANLSNNEWASKTIKKDENLNSQFFEMRLDSGDFEDVDKQILQYTNSAGKEVLIMEEGKLASVPKEDPRVTEKNLKSAMKEVSSFSDQLASISKYKFSDNGADLIAVLDKFQSRDSTKDLIDSKLQETLNASKSNLGNAQVLKIKQSIPEVIRNVQTHLKLTESLIQLKDSSTVNIFFDEEGKAKLELRKDAMIKQINTLAGYQEENRLESFSTDAFGSVSQPRKADNEIPLLKSILKRALDHPDITANDKEILKESIKTISDGLDSEKQTSVDPDKLATAFKNFTRIIP